MNATMAKIKNQHDITSEFIIQRVAGGIKLVSPDTVIQGAHRPQVTVTAMMQLPFNVYFMRTDSAVVAMNPITVDTCGWRSVKTAIGKSVRDLWPDKYATRALNNDSDVLMTQKLKIIEEYAFHGNTSDVQALSFKFPWFDANHQLLGIFGCSLILNQDHGYSLANSLALLTDTGLLSPMPVEPESLSKRPNVEKKFFSLREMEVLKQLVRGKTAKEIGRTLGLSYRTVEHHIERAKHKIGASSRSELFDVVTDYLG
jgi:DNA-binding CsgD family transcriptional regulator